MAFILEDANQQRLIEAGNNYERKTGERNPTNISVIESDYIQSDEILRDFSGIGFNVEPFPNIPEGTLWYNQDVTTTAFRAVFFGDSAGNEVDAMYKLTELAEYIRRNVLLMNETAEYVSIPWWAYVLVSAAVIAGAAAYIILKRRKGTRPRERHSLKRTVIAWGLMIPFLVLLGMFYVYPIFHNFYLSFTNYSGVNLRDYGLVGFANYRQIFTEGVKGLLGMGLWTFVFAFSVIAISFIFGVLLATLLETAGMKVARVYRLIYILPWVIPAVITLLMWQGLLETEGADKPTPGARRSRQGAVAHEPHYGPRLHRLRHGLVFLPLLHGRGFGFFTINPQGILRGRENRRRLALLYIFSYHPAAGV